MSTHEGFKGGLDKDWIESATYFSDAHLEMIFHDVTAMPKDDSDEKHMKKMRHIGNDHVHIVWNEHFRDYRRLISGDFGDCIIVVTPLPNHTFAIDIISDNVSSFPCFDATL